MSENFKQDLTKATELEVDANVVDEASTAEVAEPAVEEKVEVKEAVEEPVKEETTEVEEAPVEDLEESKEEEEVAEEHPEGCECEKCKAAKETSDKEQEKPEEKTKEEKAVEQSEEEAEVENKQKEIEELNAKLAEMEFDKKEAENIRQYQIDRANVEEQVKQQTDLLSTKLNEAFTHFGIDPNKTLDELKAEDTTKAAIAQGLIDSAMQKRDEAINKARQEITKMEDELIFNRVEKEVEKYHLTPEQMKATAETFIAIMNETGVADLAEDLRAKVKLAVAQAVMDNPRVEKEEEITEKEDGKELETIEEVPVVKEEEEPLKVEEVVEEETQIKPDLSEFKEGVDGGTTPTAAVTEDNIIETIAALPYRERTKFITENYDLYMTAMRKARAKGE
jgi:hypothetical protein|nr:MAG TPA: hypothetical protein [Caudoviricetes sp.]